MTRDEHRAQCIEAMKLRAAEYYGQPGDEALFDGLMTAAFDSIHGIASVISRDRQDAMNALEQMARSYLITPVSSVDIFLAMSAAGDLTNPPEGKP